ncbi:MAG: PTS sugar transporter subunit IIA [Rhodospirillales bacterium]|tara:strand:- start:3828 stop:4289 length:462 start_codon:yes stop_codon:yes gene_type:complete
MKIADLITPKSIIANLKATSKKQILQEMSRGLSDCIEHNYQNIFDVLLEREKLGTTGVGEGVAIPHGKIQTLDKSYGFFASIERPIDFESIDERPVDLVFLLLAPASSGAEHLKALALVSRLLKNKSSCEKLRGSSTPEALYAILAENRNDQS